ncbi:MULTISPECIES: BON domain-containing protein [unclassified Cupriavidus]|uniref:BON domain-containing protein n=1 Tax=Cupriavidus sp. H19C3 TaxID=3241603 RepID=UPI003BF83798
MKVRLLPGVVITATSLIVAIAATPVLVMAAGADADTPSSTGRTAAPRDTAATSDRAITANVQAKLAAVPGVDINRIKVNTVDGVVRLEGTIRDEAQRENILQAAKDTRGVTAVSDELHTASK